MEVPGSILEELSAEEASSQAHVQTLVGGRRLQVQVQGLAQEPLHFGQGVADRVLPDVREKVVPVVHPDERGVDRASVVIGREEAIQPRRGLGRVRPLSRAGAVLQTVLTQTFMGPAARLSQVP